MGWIDNYWISWWYHLHGWHTTGCSPPKRFHPLAMVNTGKPKEYNPFPHLKHRPGNHGWNFTHIWNHRMGVFNIRGMGLEKKHILLSGFSCVFLRALAKIISLSRPALTLLRHGNPECLRTDQEPLAAGAWIFCETCETCRREVKPSPRCRNRNDVTTLEQTYIYIYIHIYRDIYIPIKIWHIYIYLCTYT